MMIYFPFLCFFLANAGELTLCGLLVLRTIDDVVYHLVRKSVGFCDFEDGDGSLCETDDCGVTGDSFCFGHGFNLLSMTDIWFASGV